MRSLDEILGFLFHSKLGRTVCACAVGAVSFVAGGCMVFDTLDCMCGGTEYNPTCWGACDDGCQELVSCGGDCDNTILTACFGDGCEKDCGDCGTWFLTCNPSDWDCSGGCNGCDEVDCSFFGCQVTCEEPIYTHLVEINYVDINTRNTVSTKSWTLRSNEESWSQIPTSYLVPSEHYIQKSGFYLTKNGNDLSDTYANESGKITNKTSAWDVNTLYILCEEKYYGDPCTLTFYATVDGVDAPNVSAQFNNYSTFVGAKIVDLPAPPTVDGYTFKGYYFNGVYKTLQNGQYFHLYDYVSEGTPTLSIEARYESTKIIVTYGGQHYEVPYGSTLQDFVTSYNVNPTSQTGRFAGFKVVHGDNTAYDVPKNNLSSVQIQEQTTLYALFEQPVTIEYYGYYGPSDNRVFTVAEEYFENDSYTLLSKPEQDIVGLYSFAGWYKESECINQWTQSVLLDSEVSYKFYAKWNANLNYELLYYRNETETNPISRQSYTYSETNVTTLKTPDELGLSAETGYAYEGWYRKDDPNKTVVTSLPAGTYGNVELCLKKIPRSYEITLQANGGSVSPTKQTIYYGETFTLPVPTRAGYDFQGCYNLLSPNVLLTDETGLSRSEFIPSNATATKFQFLAKWEIHTYQITFINGDETQTVKDCDYNTAVGELDITPYEKTGYDFIGWFSGNKEFSPTEQVTADCAYTAKYEPKTYTITLDAGEGSVSTTEVTVKYGEKVTLSPPTRTGYVFNGWSYQSTDFADFEGIMQENYQFTYDITITAIWVPIS